MSGARTSARAASEAGIAPLTLRLLRWAGWLAWILVGAPTLASGANEPWRFFLWLLGFVLFGLGYAGGLGGRAPDATWRTWSALALQTLAVLGMVLLLCRGFEGTLLVLVAIQLGLVARLPAGVAWVLAQTLALGVAIGVHWSPRPAFLLAPPYLGFQLLAFFVLRALGAEIRSRQALAAAHTELAEAHSELRATQELRAERARLAERLRISRELHDAVGHHLVALSLRLELASRQAASRQTAGGPAADDPVEDEIAAARSLLRLMLTDLGEMVSELKRDETPDLAAALARLAGEIPHPRVHLALGSGLDRLDPATAQALLRCCQEIASNAVKHARAANLWLEVATAGDRVRLSARDDGQGAAPGAARSENGSGHGLAGMHERLAELGGSLDLATAPGEGFRITATLPLAPGAIDGAAIVGGAG